MRSILPWDDVQCAAIVGVMRQMNALRGGLKDRYGASVQEGFLLHIHGALGEATFARYANRYWAPYMSGNADELKALPGDVGFVQVRTRKAGYDHLPLHPDDPDEAPFFLLTGPTWTPEGASFEIHGWIRGRDGKVDELWGDPWGTGRPCFWVPEQQLKPVPQ